MATTTQPMEVDTRSDSGGGGSSTTMKKKRSVTETHVLGWDEVRDVADVARGGAGRRAKGNDGKSDRERQDPDLVELLARCDVLEARYPVFMAEMIRRREEFNEKLRRHGLGHCIV